MAKATINVPVSIDLSTIQRWMESSDIVEVVRCKDCKYWNSFQIGGCGFCYEWGKGTRGDGYCYKGEKNDTEHGNTGVSEDA